MKKRQTRIELFKENFKFSSGHFTIFSAQERENLHGHNFTLHASFDADVGDEGMTFDYGFAKRHIEGMCSTLNERFLLPGRSPHLRLEEGADYTYAHFNGEKIPFLARDILILPVTNVTLEELAFYFLEDFRAFTAKHGHDVTRAEMRVFSGPGQSANAVWEKAA